MEKFYAFEEKVSACVRRMRGLLLAAVLILTAAGGAFAQQLQRIQRLDALTLDATPAVTANQTRADLESDCPGTVVLSQDCESNYTGWNVLDVDGDENLWGPVSFSAYAGHSGTKMWGSQSYNGGNLTPNNWLLTPTVTMGAGAGCVSWWVSCIDGDDFAEHYQVMVAPAATAISGNTVYLNQFEPIFEETLTVSYNHNWIQHTATIPATYAGQDVIVAFVHNNCSGMWWLLIDDIVIKATDDLPSSYTITANASPAVGGTVTGGGTYEPNATVTLTATPADGYIFTSWNDGNTNATRTVTATSNATYTAYFVGSECEGNVVLTQDFETSLSGWLVRNVDSDTITWMWTDNSNAHSGTGVAFSQSYVNGLGALNSNNWLITPEVTMANGDGCVSWWVRPQNFTDHYKVMVGLGTDYANYVTIYEEDLPNDNVWVQHSATIPPTFANQNVRVAFVHNYSDGWHIYLDDITITTSDVASATYTITTAVSPAGAGSVTGGGIYVENATATLTATANTGYIFSQWSDGNTSNPRTITVTEDATYTAVFDEYTVDIDLGANFLNADRTAFITEQVVAEGEDFSVNFYVRNWSYGSYTNDFTNGDLSLGVYLDGDLVGTYSASNINITSGNAIYFPLDIFTAAEIAQYNLYGVHEFCMSVMPGTGYEEVDDEDNITCMTVTFNRTLSYTATAIGEGTITPTEGNMDINSSLTFTMVPEECHELTDVTVNGVSMMSSVTPPSAMTEVFRADFSDLTRTTTGQQCGAYSTAGLPTSYTTAGWSSSRAYESAGKLKLGASNGQGSVTLPAIDLNGDYEITFKANAWNNDQSRIYVTVNGVNQLVSGLRNNNGCDMDEFTITGTNGTAGTVIAFKGYQARNSRFFLDDIVVKTSNPNADLTSSILTVDNISDDLNVVATFGQKRHEMAYTITGNGTVTPATTPDTVDCGSDYTFTMTADEGWHIAEYTLDGNTVVMGNNSDVTASVSLTNVNADANLNVTFAINTYNVTATANGNGNVTPATATVEHGGSQTITMIPATCQDLTDVTVNGVSRMADVVPAAGMAEVFRADFNDVTGSGTANCGATGTLWTAYDGWSSTLVYPANNQIKLGTGSGLGSVTLPAIDLGSNYEITFKAKSWSNTSEKSSIKVIVNGEEHLIEGLNKDSDCNLDEFTVTGTNGTANSTITFTAITANSNRFFLDDIVVKTTDANATAYALTVDNITEDIAVEATFETIQYNMSYNITGNGTVTPATTTAINCGTDYTYTMTAGEGWHIAEYTIGGNTTTLGNNSDVTADVTVTNVTADTELDVVFAINTYNVALCTATGGALTATTTTVNHGDDLDITITADATNGYHIATITCGNDVVALDNNSDVTYTYTIGNIVSDTAICATFALNRYTITASAGANGSINPVGDSIVEWGSAVAYTITPDACHYISTVLVDGTDVRENDSTAFSYTFNNVTENHTIAASFDIYRYAMTADITGNGEVTTATVDCGSDYTFTMTAGEGWHIASYTLEGVTTTLGDNSDVTATATATNVTTDTEISVVFAINTYNVALCTATGGELTAAATTVNHGDNLGVTITADAANGYHIESITCGADVVDLDANTDVTYTYTIGNIVSDTAICAVFALNRFTITASADPSGVITPSGDTVVRYGDEVTYTMTVGVECSRLDYYVVDGDTTVATTNNITYTFSNITADHSIRINTVGQTYNMASTAVGEGTVTSDPVAPCSLDFDYVITANEGYHIDSIYLDGALNEVFPYSETSYTTTHTLTIPAIDADHSLVAYFSINTYTVTGIIGPHGSMTNEGTAVVDHGTQLVYTITPDACYYITEVLVNGTDIRGTDSTAFTYTVSVSEPLTVEANFTIFRYAMTETHTGNGTVSTDTINCGGSYTFEMTADEGWYIAEYTVNGTTTTLGNSSDVTATYTVTGADADTEISVVFDINTFNIDVTVDGNGTTTPGDTIVEWGSNIDVEIAADHGYHIADITVDGTSIFTSDSNDDSTYIYTFTDVRDNHTMDVTFAINVYEITATAGDHGRIMMPGTQYINFNESLNFTINADACYHINAITVDGVEEVVFNDNTDYYVYNLNNVDANHTIEVDFAINTYDIVATAGANGTITPDGTTTLECGGSQSFTITPDANYEIESVIVNGINIGTPDSYTVSDIHSDYTIEVNFTATAYTLTSISYGHGTITPMGETVVEPGDAMTYTLTPEACYTVSEILVDGVSYLDQISNNELTISDIQSNMLVQAYFQIMTYTVDATANEGGYITESAIYNCGTDVTYSIVPDACHSIVSVEIDGVDMGAIDSYTFSAIDDDHTVVATFEMNTYTITSSVNDDAMGAITATETFNCGEMPTYEITPNEGYYIVNVTVDGEDMGAISSYTFAALNADHSIAAELAVYTYTLTAYSNTGVTVEPALGETTVEYGDTYTYTFTADDCYDIVDVLVDGESVGAVDNYTFSAIDANHVISVNAQIKTYTITASVNGVGGTITPMGETTVNCDGSQFYSIAASAGYEIEDVLVDGASVGAVNSYLFENVTADATIEVVFHELAADMFTITATVNGVGGTITPAGAVSVARGASQTFVMTPDQFYRVFEVYVDGTLINATSTYTFGNVDANHTIEVVFTETDCPVPTHAWTSDITENSAMLNWTDMNVTSYTIRYKLASDTTGIYTEVSGITDNFYTLTGLEMNTTYVWNVKSVCIANTAESVWSAQQTFRTLEDPTIGIHEAAMSDVKVYAYGSDIYVVNNSSEQITGVQVYDMMGRAIYNGTVASNPQVISLNAANGAYVVRVTTANDVRNYKVSISQR